MSTPKPDAPVAQPLSAEERNAILRRHGINGPMADPLNGGACVNADEVARQLATLDAARSVPDNAALRAVEQAVADKRIPVGYEDFPRIGRTATVRLADIYSILAAAPASPAGLDAAIQRARALEFPYKADSGHSAGYENGWYDGRGAAVRELLAIASPAGLDAGQRNLVESARAAYLFLNMRRHECGLPWPEGYEHPGCPAALASPEEASPDDYVQHSATWAKDAREASR